MGTLSEVSRLFAQRAGDLEKAREIFTAEMRSFVTGILAGISRTRSEPWLTARVRLDLPREIEVESRAGSLSSQYALARVVVRFKQRTNYNAIADIRFGIEYDSTTETFVWQVSLVPLSRFQRVDDNVWRHLRAAGFDLPGSTHQERANTVRFVQRPLSEDVTAEVAFNDVKTILEFMLTADTPLGQAVGFDGVSDEAV